MQQVPRPLLVLHEDRTFRERLHAAALTQGLEMRTVAGWDELFDLVRSAPASALLVVDPYAGTDDMERALSIELSSLLNRFPSLTITSALAVGPGCLADVLRLGQWGVAQIIDMEEEMTPVALAHRLVGARGRPLRGLVERALPSYTSSGARAILRAASSIVAEGGQGQDLARTLRITPRTLSRWCRRAGLPPPKRLLVWMRILLAAEFLDDVERPFSAVAAACGYAADSSLRMALRRFTGMTPTELRARGAFGVAATEFVAALDEAREPRRQYRATARRLTEADRP